MCLRTKCHTKKETNKKIHFRSCYTTGKKTAASLNAQFELPIFSPLSLLLLLCIRYTDAFYHIISMQPHIS